MNYKGTHNNDDFTGTSGHDVFQMGQGGNDTVQAGGGNDEIIFGAAFTAQDSVDGGSGTDTLVLAGDYTGANAVTMLAGTLTNVETISLGAGHSYDLTTNDATVAAGQRLLVNGGTLGAGDTLTFDGSAETDGFFRITGGAGNDTLTGGAGNDTFVLVHGGDDVVHGGGGNDVFQMAAALSPGDRIDGGTGSDIVELNGNYSGAHALTLLNTTLTNVETLFVAPGFSYNLTTADGNVAAGQLLTVNGAALGSGNVLTFNGSAETDGRFAIAGGAGNDVLTGGAGNDSFNLSHGGNDTVHGGGGNDTFNMAATFTAADSIDGGAGNDILNLDGNYSAGVTFGATTLTNVETIALAAGHDYNLTTSDATVASGKMLTVDGSALGASDTLTFSGAAETDGGFVVTAGAGNDTITLGSAAVLAASTIAGGTGNDTLALNGDFSAPTTLASGSISGIETVSLQGASNHYDIAVTGDIADAGKTLTVHASAASSLSLDLTGATSPNYAVTGSGGDDTILFAGNLHAADTIDGGAGNDTVELAGDYSGGLTFDATTITNVETLKLDSGHSYFITTADGTVASGQTLTVDASGLSGSDVVSVDGSAETDGKFAFIAGNSSGGFTGGAGNDTYDLTRIGASVTSFNALDSGGSNTFTFAGNYDGSRIGIGGAGHDTVVLNGNYSSLNFTNMTGVTDLVFENGHSYSGVTFDPNDDISGGQQLTVDASALDSTHSISADFSNLTHSSVTAIGGAGDDTFTAIGLSTLADDSFDGGSGGNDTLVLEGNVLGFTFGANALTNIDTIQLTPQAANNEWDLTTNDANVAAGATLTVDATALGAAAILNFDGSAETAGFFHIKGGAGQDSIVLGGPTVLAGSTINGGGGNDSLTLNGDYSAGFTFGATTMTNVETLTLDAGHSYNLTTNNATVASGQTLTVDGSALGSGNALTLNGAAETDGSFTIIGGAGSDTLTGGSHADIFDLTHGGNDTAHGGGGNDIFNLGAAFTAADSIDGGTGVNDVLNLDGDYSAGVTFGATTLSNVEKIVVAAGHSYNLTTNDATVAPGQTLTVDGSALGGGDVLTFDGSAETDGSFVLIGGAAGDVLTGGAQADTFDLTRGGNDAAHGGGGNDTFNLSAAFTAADAIDGGSGSDTLNLNGDYSAGVIFGATTLTNVENIVLTAGHSYNLTTNDATVAGGQTLTVDGSALGAGEVLTFDGSAETNGSFSLVGGAGNDSLAGGGQDDTFDLSQGGNDTASGGNGNDTFNMGAAFTAADVIDGGAGNDTLNLNGDYSAGVTLGAATLTNVENIVLAAGHSYNLTTNDATVGSGKTLTVDGSALGAGNTLTVNGSAESDGSFYFYGGAGTDTLSGGSQNDTFNMGANLTAADTIDGGGGYNTLLLNGDYSAGLTLGATTIANIGDIILSAGHSYNLTSNDANVASGQTLTVDGSAVGAGNSVTFNGSAESDGSFYFYGGAGTDTLTGGAQNDTFNMGANLAAGDALNGGGGSDTVELNGDYSGGLTFGANTITNIETLTLDAGHSYNLATNDATVASGQTLTVDASALGASNTLTFDGSAETDGFFAITGGAGADSFTIANRAVFLGSTFNGGGGNDTLTLNYSYNNFNQTILGATTIQNVDTIDFLGGANYNYSFIANDANVAAGQTLTLDASGMTAHGLFWYDVAETDGFLNVKGGPGTDNITLSSEAVLAGSTIDLGVGSSNVLTLNGDFSTPFTFTAANMQHVTTLSISGTSNAYHLTTVDANVAAGATLIVTGTSSSLYFDGSAETDGKFSFSGYNGNDTLIGGAGNDSFFGGNGADTMTGGGGADNFFYTFANSQGVAQSTSTHYDTITDINFSVDTITPPKQLGLPSGIDAAINGGVLSTATFDSDLGNAVNASTLAAGHAVLFTADSGDLANHTFLVVDENGMAGYQTAADLVIDVTGYTGTLTTSSFV